MHMYTVKPVLGDHCYDRPPVLKDHIFPADSPHINATESDNQRPELRNLIFMANRVVFQDKFYSST